MAHLFVTSAMTVKDVIIDGADLRPSTENLGPSSCRNSRTLCCTGTTGVGTTTANCKSAPTFSNWDANSENYYNNYDYLRYYGIFVMSYIRDYTGAPIPTLNLENVEVRNFWYSKYHTSFVQLDPFAS